MPVHEKHTHVSKVFIMNKKLTGFLAGLVIALIAPMVQAVPITSSLGNTTSGLTDGQTTTVVGLIPILSGQPAPFDAADGNDVLAGDPFDQSWTHSFGAIADTILSALITIGIADHDSKATGSQVAAFTLDGNAFTTQLDGMFEADQSEDTVYNEYTIALTGSALTDLIDGTLIAALTLQGPGRVTPLFPLPGPNPPEDSTGSNGAFLIYSTLEIQTEDSTAGVPEPSTLALMSFGLAGIGYRRQRRKKAA